MKKLYKIRDFLDDESVEKFINELIDENIEYLRSKYHQILNMANKAKTRI